jgi:hypothetical protein
VRKAFWVVFAISCFAFQATAPTRVSAQSTPAQIRKGDSLVVADTIPKEDHTARNAFIRALIVPGWGHFSIGANRRGAVFVALQGTSWFMLTKTLSKLHTAQNERKGFEKTATDSLNALMASDTVIARQLSDTVAFNNALAANATVARSRRLVSARQDQRQDWITYTLFFTMAGAVDAYVAANLRDFPKVSILPRRDGSVSLGFTLFPGLPSHAPRRSADPAGPRR